MVGVLFLFLTREGTQIFANKRMRLFNLYSAVGKFASPLRFVAVAITPASLDFVSGAAGARSRREGVEIYSTCLETAGAKRRQPARRVGATDGSGKPMRENRQPVFGVKC